MRKSFLLICAFSILSIASCKKEDDEQITPVSVTESGTDNTDALARTTVPSTFKQKLLMEMFSSAHCATCPDAEYKYDAYAAQYPDRVYAVNLHDNDAMQHPQYDFLDGILNVTVFSSSTFNRRPFSGYTVLPKTMWKNSGAVGNCLSQTASTGLMINTTKSGSTATATVTAGFNKTMSGNYKMTIYLVEDKVTGTGSGYNQSNYYNNIATSPFYQLGNPIIGYQHGYVLRQVLTPSIGVSVPATSIKAGGSFTKSYSFSISGYNAANLYIIAFVNKAGTTTTTHQIMNVQRVKLGSNKAWD